jgi:hypothetical protein
VLLSNSLSGLLPSAIKLPMENNHTPVYGGKTECCRKSCQCARHEGIGPFLT